MFKTIHLRKKIKNEGWGQSFFSQEPEQEDRYSNILH